MDSHIPSDARSDLYDSGVEGSPTTPTHTPRGTPPSTSSPAIIDQLHALASTDAFKLFSFEDVAVSGVTHSLLAIVFVMVVFVEVSIFDLVLWTFALGLLGAALVRSLSSLRMIPDDSVPAIRLAVPKDLVRSVSLTFADNLLKLLAPIEAALSPSESAVRDAIYTACAILTLTSFSCFASASGLMTLWLAGLGFASAYRLAGPQIDDVLTSQVLPHVTVGLKSAIELSDKVHAKIRTAPNYLVPAFFAGFAVFSFFFYSFVSPFTLAWFLAVIVTFDSIVRSVNAVVERVKAD